MGKELAERESTIGRVEKNSYEDGETLRLEFLKNHAYDPLLRKQKCADKVGNHHKQRQSLK